MNNQNIYKLYQIMEYLSLKFDYQAIFIKDIKKDEIWLINENNPNYQIIRLTTNDLETLNYDQDRINKTIRNFSVRMVKDIKFLDIHIGEYEVLDEKHDTISIDENYYAGISLDNIFPGLKNIIHEIDNQEKEINDIVLRINQHSSKLNQSRKKKRFFGQSSKATTIIMIICIINFTLALLLSLKYDMSSAQIILGADYKTFTLGLKQLYRLITVGFTHGSISHLFMNMLSLSVLGPYIERKYDTKFYLLTLFLSILVGSLTSGILTNNILAVGISGGLYGLSVIYFIDIIKKRAFNPNSLFMIIIINLMINFMSSVSWQAHLGGAICGLVMYMIKESEYKKQSIALLILLICILGYKYLTIKIITPIYISTDKEIIEIYNDFGLKSYASNISKRLIETYINYK